jgi:hypothetical protein
MDWTQAIAIIVSILVPMLGGFAWLIHKIGNLETRLTIVETILAMMGTPIKTVQLPGKNNK